MPKLLLNPRTAVAYERFMKSPSQVLIITGEAGSGKTKLAHTIISALAGISEDELQSDPRLFHGLSENAKGSGIEMIREIIQFLSLRPTDDSKWNRFILLSDAKVLSNEAQSALLKSLESLPEGTIIVFMVDAATDLLSTIRSRAQMLHVLPVSHDRAHEHYKDEFDHKNFLSVYALSGGNVGTLHSLLIGKDDQLTESATLAKNLLSEPLFERLKRTSELSTDNEKLLSVLTSLQRILGIVYKSQVKVGANDKARTILDKRRYVNQTQEALLMRGNPKLVVCNLLINL